MKPEIATTLQTLMQKEGEAADGTQRRAFRPQVPQALGLKQLKPPEDVVAWNMGQFDVACKEFCEAVLVLSCYALVGLAKSFVSGSEGHAVAAKSTASQVEFFDPNFGQASVGRDHFQPFMQEFWAKSGYRRQYERFSLTRFDL